jgi:hypothetical protein
MSWMGAEPVGWNMLMIKRCQKRIFKALPKR